jgi:hypothetical protein
MNRTLLFMAIGCCFVPAVTVLPVGAESRCWTGSDYVDLYFRHFNGQAPLPHVRKPDQMALFERLVDPCSLERIAGQSVPREEKLREIRIILASLGNFRSAYEVAVLVGEPLERELAAVQAFSLEVAAAQVRVDAGAAHPIDNASALLTMVEGVLDSIVNAERYSPSLIVLMADAVIRHYPVISAALSENQRQRLRGKALSLAPQTTDRGVLDAVHRMQGMIEGLP